VCTAMWFVISITAAALVFIWFMPKRITRKEIYITWWTMASLAVFTDLFLGIAPLDLFDYTNNPKPEPLSILIEILMPACFGIIFLNFMPMRWKPFLLYMACYILMSVGIEWITVLTGYLRYKGWNLWLSALVYLCGTLYLKWHLHFIRKPDHMPSGK